MNGPCFALGESVSEPVSEYDGQNITVYYCRLYKYCILRLYEMHQTLFHNLNLYSIRFFQFAKLGFYSLSFGVTTGRNNPGRIMGAFVLPVHILSFSQVSPVHLQW